MKSNSPKKPNRVTSSKRNTAQQKANQFIGHPVLLVLKDGTHYVGVISAVEKNEIILSGTRGQIKLDSSGAIQDQAQVSGILSMLLGGLSKGAAQSTPSDPAPAQENASGGGMWGQLIPNIRLGMNMLQMIVPLMGSFKI